MPIPGILRRAPVVMIAIVMALAAFPLAAQEIGPDQSLTITFVGCPPGGDWSAPPPGCSDVVPAPASAVLTGPDWTQRVRDIEPNADGSYTIPVPAGTPIGLVDFFSPDFNAFTFDGVDTISRWYGEVTVGPGESRDITVFYWNGPVDLIMPAENTLVVNVMTCGEGIDPTVDATGCVPTVADAPGLAVTTPPLRQVDMAEYLSRDGGVLTYAGLPAYTQAQIVVRQPLAGYDRALVTGDAEVIEGNAATVFLLRNEVRTVNVYFFAPNGETAPTPTPNPAADAGTLRLSLLACPEGVVPHDDPASCTEAITSPDTAMVSFPETGERLSLSRFARDETGAYVIPDVRGSVVISGILPGDGQRIASDGDRIAGEEVTFTIEPGVTRDGHYYFYDAQ